MSAATSAILALDTSTPLASVALQVGDRIFQRAEKVTTYSERLLVLIDELFTEGSCTPKDLVGVAVGAGPGSFTGLRIGLGTAKGLCLGAGASLVMISSLEALAARAPAESTVVTALDAFRGEVYVGLFDVDARGVPVARSESLAAFTVLPTALPSLIAEHGGARFCIGDGFLKYPVAISDGAIALEGAGPRARELLQLARDRFDKGMLDDLRHAVPRYVRASAPEEDKKPKESK